MADDMWCENCKTEGHDTHSQMCPYMPPEVRARWKKWLDALQDSSREDV